MARIVQHIPAFVELMDDPIPEATFESLEDLLNVAFVKRWSESKRFYRFSYKRGLLMAELEGGTKWWVVGRMTNFSEEMLKSLNLPQWERPD